MCVCETYIINNLSVLNNVVERLCLLRLFKPLLWLVSTAICCCDVDVGAAAVSQLTQLSFRSDGAVEVAHVHVHALSPLSSIGHLLRSEEILLPTVAACCMLLSYCVHALRAEVNLCTVEVLRRFINCCLSSPRGFCSVRMVGHNVVA